MLEGFDIMDFAKAYKVIRRIFSLSQCAALIKGNSLYGRFGSYYADHRGGTFS